MVTGKEQQHNELDKGENEEVARIGRQALEGAEDRLRLMLEIARPKKIFDKPKPNTRYLAENMAKVAYERFHEGVVGCCEEPWELLPESFTERLIDAQESALKWLVEDSKIAAI